MNLATIERMVRDGDLSLDALKYLVDCRGECEWLDFKQLFRLESDYDISAFAKDALAMKNTGGGYLVIGVQDKTWVPVGLASELPYDAKSSATRFAARLDLTSQWTLSSTNSGTRENLNGSPLSLSVRRQREGSDGHLPLSSMTSNRKSHTDYVAARSTSVGATQPYALTVQRN